jgi:hypothetical protein
MNETLILTMITTIILLVFYIITIVRGFSILCNTKKGTYKNLLLGLLIFNIIGGQSLIIPFVILAIMVWSKKIKK